MPYKLKIIQEFELFKPVITGQISVDLRLRYIDEIKDKYLITSLSEEEYITDCYFHVPVILDPEDIPWEHANAFILFKLTSNKERSTIEGYAKVLILFANFCEQEDIDYLQSPSKLRSPLARFKRDQLDKLESRKLSPSTVKERLSKLVCFYRYLVDEFKIKFTVKPWISDKEGLKLIQLQDRSEASQK
ncbi:MAG: site-specific integrase [Alteromonadaceae bacterium]|nr:site-specific integrase [Alteromonadaceae bacterium]